MNKIDVFSKVTNIFNQMLEAKVEFAAYIRDTTQPLEDRWNMFLLVDDAFKNHESSIVRLEGLPYEYVQRMWEPNRCQKIVMTELVEHIEEGKLTLYEDDRNGFTVQSKAIINLCDIELLKEDILCHNLGSFNYDW